MMFSLKYFTEQNDKAQSSQIGKEIVDNLTVRKFLQANSSLSISFFQFFQYDCRLLVYSLNLA